MQVNHIQATTVSDTKVVSPGATSLKTQDFKETMRLTSDPKDGPTVHSGPDAKGDKKGREEKKERGGLASVSTAVLSTPLESVGSVPFARQNATESPSNDTNSLSPLAGSGGGTGTVSPVQPQVAVHPLATKDDVSTGYSANDASSAPKQVSTSTCAPSETRESAQSADAPSKTDSADSAKPSALVAPAATVNQTATAAVLPGSFSLTNIVDPTRETNELTSPEKMSDGNIQAVESSRTEPGTTYPGIDQAAQIPVPIQEMIAPQGSSNGVVFSGLEGASTSVRTSAAGTASSVPKGKSAISDLRGKREDARVETKNTDTPSSVQPPSKLALPADVLGFNAGHAGTTQGSDLAVAAQAAGSGAPSGLSTQSSADPKAMSGADAAAAPNGAFLSAGQAMATPALNSAHLTQSIHQSEMKLGMNSVEFGSISINATVGHQGLSAQISLDHPELSRVLTGHLFAAEEKLGQAYGLQARVEVQDAGSSLHRGSQQQADGDPQSSRSSPPRGMATGVATNPLPGSATAVATITTSRLDIRI